MENFELARVVSEAKQGKTEAFDALFKEYQNDIYNLALREVKNPDIACDVVQECFVEIIQTIGKLREEAAFVSWMKAIAYHQCTRYYKKKDVRHETVADEREDMPGIFDTLEEENEDYIPDKAMENEDFKNTVRAFVDGLPDAQRSAVMMKYFDNLSVREISEIQGVPENTVLSRLNYGRKAIKSSVEDYEKKNNIRLHAIPFIPLFRLLYQSEAALSAAQSAAVAEGIGAATGVALGGSVGGSSAVSATATATAVGAAKAAGIGLGAKIVAGVVAAAIAVTVPIVAVVNSGSDDSEDNDVSAFGEQTEEQTEKATKAYEELLKKGVTERGLQIKYYAYIYLDEDNIPELLVADNDGTTESWSACEVYDYKDRKLHFCGAVGARYDYFYMVNDEYVLGRHRKGNHFISVDQTIKTTSYHWNDDMTRNDPAISYNDGEWEYLTEEEFEFYNIMPGDNSPKDAFIKTAEPIILTKNSLRTADVIPSGCSYHVAATGETLHEGDVFPEPATGDIYKDGIYEFRFNYRPHCYWIESNDWNKNEEYNGWGVKVADREHEEFPDLPDMLANRPIVFLDYTYSNCCFMTKLPRIPQYTVSMDYTFNWCVELRDTNNIIIPATVKK